MKRTFFYVLLLLFLITNFLNLRKLHLIDWDEGVFALQAQWISTNGSAGKPFNFQTPPLFQFLVALLFKILGVNDWCLPLISIICSVLTLFLLYLFVRSLYNEDIGLFSAMLFMSTEYFLFFSKSGLSDALFLLFFICALYFFHLGLESKKAFYYAICGFFVLISSYTKYSGPILFLILFIIGISERKKVSGSWVIFSILIPLILYLPYFFIFIKIVTFSKIVERHGRLFGINHLKFLYYILRFTPLIFFTSILYRIKKDTDFLVLKILVPFFIVLGFYYHYLRLAYPLIPILSIFSAGFIYKFKRLRYLLIVSVFVFNLIIGLDTLTYHSSIPIKIAEKADSLCNLNNIRYLLPLTPPNILFYMKGDILIPEFNQQLSFIEDFGLLKKTHQINKKSNLFKEEKQILLIYSSIFKDLEQDLEPILQVSKYIDEIEFVDAPIYYKDIFNPLRKERQLYKFYLLETDKINLPELERLWDICLKERFSVVKRY
jgi:hypothetical protein